MLADQPGPAPVILYLSGYVDSYCRMAERERKKGGSCLLARPSRKPLCLSSWKCRVTKEERAVSVSVLCVLLFGEAVSRGLEWKDRVSFHQLRLTGCLAETSPP